MTDNRNKELVSKAILLTKKKLHLIEFCAEHGMDNHSKDGTLTQLEED